MTHTDADRERGFLDSYLREWSDADRGYRRSPGGATKEMYGRRLTAAKAKILSALSPAPPEGEIRGDEREAVAKLRELLAAADMALVELRRGGAGRERTRLELAVANIGPTLLDRLASQSPSPPSLPPGLLSEPWRWATDEMFRQIELAVSEGRDRGASNKSIGSVVFNEIIATLFNFIRSCESADVAGQTGGKDE